MVLLYIEEDQDQVIVYNEQAKRFALPMRCNDYLNYLCESFGSSLSGRRQAACKFLRIRQKAPIYIREGILLFQSVDAATSHRIWINYHGVKRIVKEGYQTRFLFMDHSELLADMEYRSAQMQMHRCDHYDYTLTIRFQQDSLENGEYEWLQSMMQG